MQSGLTSLHSISIFNRGKFSLYCGVMEGRKFFATDLQIKMKPGINLCIPDDELGLHYGLIIFVGHLRMKV